MSDDIATEVIAKYAVLGTRVELERTLPLEPGETVVVGVIAHTKLGGNPFYGSRRGFLRVSNRRPCIVRHYGFIRDRIIVIPPGAITAVEGGGPAEAIRITFRADEGERVITIVNWRAAGTDRPQPRGVAAPRQNAERSCDRARAGAEQPRLGRSV